MVRTGSHAGFYKQAKPNLTQFTQARLSSTPKLLLKQTFPRKDVPPAPPKHAFLRITSSRLLLEERRYALEEWMQKLLSDIEPSRSASIAAFLELEAAVRSSFQDWNQLPETTSSVACPHPVEPGSSASFSESSRLDLALPCGTSLTGATGDGVLGESILDQHDDYLNSMLDHRKENIAFVDSNGRTGSIQTYRESVSEEEHYTYSGHVRKNSSESIGSDVSSVRGSELLAPGVSSSLWDGPVDLQTGVAARRQMEHLTGLDMQFLDAAGAQIILPNKQRQKLTRLLITMQQRIGTAKTDMEDLIARLNQETSVKEYLTTKVKDLEVELEATKEKGRETLQQAILAERERITQMQWDMDELRRTYSEMESNLKNDDNAKTCMETEITNASGEREMLLEELETKQKEVTSLRKHLEEVEAKSKVDIKVLVKEVKSLRNSQKEMKNVLSQYLEEKTELERILDREKQRSACVYFAREKILQECRLLRKQLQECSVNFFMEEQYSLPVDLSLPDALTLLETSDNRIHLLLAEAQLLARGDEQGSSDNGDNATIAMSSDDASIAEEDTTKILTDLLADNAHLRIGLNSIMRSAVSTAIKPEKEESDGVVSKNTALKWLLDS